VHLEARTRIVAGPEGLFAITTGRRTISEDPGWAPVASSLHKVFSEGIVWAAAEGDPFERQFAPEAAYEENNAMRRRHLAMTTDFLCVPWLRGRTYVDLCWGDLSVEDGEAIEWEGAEAAVKYVAAEPGEVWEAVLAPPGSPIAGIGSKDLCLAAALGLTIDRARSILDRLGAMPARITSVQPLPGERRELVTVTTFVEAEEALEAELELARRESSPPQETVETAQALDGSLSSADAILKRLLAVSRGEAEPPAPLTLSGLFLRLSKRLRREELPEAVNACREAGDALVQVELARAVLRAGGPGAWPLLRGLVLGPSGATAMSVVEALAAEGHPSSIPALFHVLGKRREYGDVGQALVVDWALRHVRALSEVPPEQVLEGAGVPPGGEGEDLDPAFDLDFWLRWHEQVKRHLPGI